MEVPRSLGQSSAGHAHWQRLLDSRLCGWIPRIGLIVSLLLPAAGYCATPPAVPPFESLPLPYSSNVRLTPQGEFEWLSSRWINNNISLCTAELTIDHWNPATGATHRQGLGQKGSISDQLPLHDGTMFIWLVPDCDQDHHPKEDHWRAAWYTSQGVISTELPAPADELAQQLVAMSDDTVFVLDRGPKTHYLSGHVVRRQGQQLVVEAEPELPQAYRGDVTAVALDDHRLMVVGGTDSEYRACAIASSCRASTKILDLHSKQWSDGPNMLEPRSEASAFRLSDGSVIVAGGWTAKDNWGPGPSRSAERWDPARNVFTSLPPMPEATARAKGRWLPGYEGRIVLFAEGVSAGLPAFDVATQTWFNAGSWQQGSEEGACAFFPFLFEGRFYAWQRFRSEGHYSSRSCGLDDARLASLRFPANIVSQRKSPPDPAYPATGRDMPEVGFLPLQADYPAVMIGGLLHAGMNNYGPTGTVEAATAAGELIPLASLTYARHNPAVYRFGDGILVLGGKADSVYRRDEPHLPAEWLPRIDRGLNAQWQVLPETPFKQEDIIGRSEDRLFVLGGDDEIDQVQVSIQDGTPRFQRSAWLHMAHARHRDGTDSPVQLRELADGRIVITGGDIQNETAALLTNTSCCRDVPDEYVDIGPFLPELSFDTYAPATKQWTRSPPSKLAGGKSTILEDGRVVKAHLPSEDQDSIRVEVFDPAANQWFEGKAPLPGFVGTRRWFELQGELLLSGEFETTENGERPRGIQRFDPKTGSWSWLWKDNLGRNYRDYLGQLIMVRLADGKTLAVPEEGL